MLIFDYALTFGSEVSLFWTRRLHLATPFLAIRLLMLLSAFFTFATEGNVSVTSVRSIHSSGGVQAHGYESAAREVSDSLILRS